MLTLALLPSQWGWQKRATANDHPPHEQGRYNFLELQDGRTVTMSELKTAHLAPA